MTGTGVGTPDNETPVGQAGALWHPSPNCGPRRDGLLPELIVIHHTAMIGAKAALKRLCDPAAEVSAHYLIGADGRLWQMVDERARAWHAGEGEWLGRGDVNSRSIGIELDNAGPRLGHPPFAAPMMAVLDRLLAGIMARWGVGAAGVIAHSDMAPGRKADPGPAFDWQRLALQGLAVWPASAPEEIPDPSLFDHLLIGCGYPAGVGHAERLAAFRLRFRPRATGALDGRDMALARGLAIALRDMG